MTDFQPITPFMDDSVPVNPSSMSQFSLDSLIHQFDRMKPTRILEIGSYLGGTLYQWMKHAPNGSLFVSVNLSLQPYWMTPKQIISQWKKYAGDRNHSLTLIDGDSRAEATVNAVRSVSTEYDWLFIDGGHMYDVCKPDWDNYSPMVRVGGAIGLHDVNCDMPGWCEVPRLWDDIKASHNMAMFTDSALDPGCGIVYL
jgi:cephalosporin hydroxylase